MLKDEFRGHQEFPDKFMEWKETKERTALVEAQLDAEMAFIEDK